MEMPTFDALKDLAQRDPEGFERLRAAAIEDCIRRSSECNQRRLRGLQFVIDARRRTAGSPMKALLDIQAMMYDSLLGLQQALLVQQRPCAPTTPTSARVLRFRSHRSSVD
ncbi:DUF3135 domain-containing protein [Marinobacter panjinensis]|uniref:DUF3135 domain-containing protein n=1 Tax=Marinobacter panjinensis TaxID=2576384 RepID=A0A4U6R1N1_9GAMM|nr:DUF3135 domain-containing protein [Marinobacter panjinensis]MCR8915422.1 DUF3135 domain-containing protein [Marinobacter panjinensis]TKV66678.1 DUF3135 domain-containing protein [Marinobacter panjinensis]